MLTFYGLVGPFDVYVKKCSSCGVFYRYQECKDGIHNIDDKLFVETRLYMLMKENLQEHNTISGTVEALNRVCGTKVDAKKVVDGYFMYDVLSTEDYPFYCVQCGHHPHILVADLNRKVAFQCNLNDVEDVDDTESDTVGDVDCDKFWKDAECNILASAFPDSVSTKFSIKPSFKNWSPFMGKKTRKSNILLNTEYMKLNRKTGEINPEFLKEMNEERLFEIISDKTYKELLTLAKEMNMTHLSKKNKRDILKDIYDKLQSKNQNMKKMFLKMGGFSGGYLTYNCVHGISYYLKMPLRSEGARDYVDGLLSMKHIPNVTVTDMPQLLVRHAKRSRKKDVRRTKSGNNKDELFFPFEGRAGDCNDTESMRKAKDF